MDESATRIGHIVVLDEGDARGICISGRSEWGKEQDSDSAVRNDELKIDSPLSGVQSLYGVLTNTVGI